MLTDNGVQSTRNLPDHSTPEEEAAIAAFWAARGEPRIHLVHAFGHACTQLGIEQQLTKPCHPWTNGQVGRTGRTIKEATIRRYHSVTHDELRAHLPLFVDAYNYGRRLTAVRDLTPCGALCQSQIKQPKHFKSTRLTITWKWTPKVLLTCHSQFFTVQQDESMFFLGRKNQRTFTPWAQGRPRARNPVCKVFLLLFLQKKKSLAFLPETASCFEVHNSFSHCWLSREKS